MWLARLLSFSLFVQIFVHLDLVGVGVGAAKTDMELNFEEFTCNSTDPKRAMRTLSCSLSKNSKRRAFNLNGIFNRDVTAFNVNLLIVLPRKGGDFVLLNLTNFDGCQMLANTNQVTLVQLLRSNLVRYSNYPSKCPLLRDKAYYIRNFRVDLELLPAFAFETNINVWFDMLVERNKIMQGFLRARISMKNGRTIKIN